MTEASKKAEWEGTSDTWGIQQCGFCGERNKFEPRLKGDQMRLLGAIKEQNMGFIRLEMIASVE